MSKQEYDEKHKELNEFERGKIIGLSEEGYSRRKISKILEIPKSTVQDTIKKFLEIRITQNLF